MRYKRPWVRHTVLSVAGEWWEGIKASVRTITQYTWCSPELLSGRHAKSLFWNKAIYFLWKWVRAASQNFSIRAIYVSAAFEFQWKKKKNAPQQPDWPATSPRSSTEKSFDVRGENLGLCVSRGEVSSAMLVTKKDWNKGISTFNPRARSLETRDRKSRQDSSEPEFFSSPTPLLSLLDEHPLTTSNRHPFLCPHLAPAASACCGARALPACIPSTEKPHFNRVCSKLWAHL